MISDNGETQKKGYCRLEKKSKFSGTNTNNSLKMYRRQDLELRSKILRSTKAFFFWFRFPPVAVLLLDDLDRVLGLFPAEVALEQLGLDAHVAHHHHHLRKEKSGSRARLKIIVRVQSTNILAFCCSLLAAVIPLLESSFLLQTPAVVRFPINQQ